MVMGVDTYIERQLHPEEIPDHGRCGNLSS
jgi:hypothetical protein